ncbi:hypothetical protein ThidrDRAFT_1816 [Thiorhodococcus drewsii AZ1]|uniref:Uncharacterized protein n=1 Tax=Thiorhodococcus drewsii AZ1 TaxID=765913 RepID=G2E0X8_9GAMM|nr:hypothetical protein [Thiorhodococcus drewsii]EGV31615.1 hypothetical protein ThidrDRAFT_1816 [Thiorhodococcus drewsii AZ1]
MSHHPPLTTAESAERQFRARVFKPAEGIFLFHPRAMERLIAQHLDDTDLDGSIPALPYYLMPTRSFLEVLETENPEALAVVEGLNLPNQVILLPTPFSVRSDAASFTRLLRDYWARRFEGEVARSWQEARNDNQDQERFGPTALRGMIGLRAFAEVREVLEHDDIVPPGLDDAPVCRAFVALIARLRYFSPGIRGYFFPAIRDWAELDRWLTESGLDLPPPETNGPLPQLLERSRPDHRCGPSARHTPLPLGLSYLSGDPDRETDPSLANGSPPSLISHREQSNTLDEVSLETPFQGASDGAEARCLAALRQGSQLPRRNWRTGLHDLFLAFSVPFLNLMLVLTGLFRLPWRPRKPARGMRLSAHLTLFSREIRLAQRAEHQDRHSLAIARLARAQHRFEAMGEPCAPDADRVRQILARRRSDIEQALADLLAAQWKLSPLTAHELNGLTERLGEAVHESRRSRTACSLLKTLERVLLESRTTYYRLRPVHWMLTLGRDPLRQILPFQANLKALRALDSAMNRLERLGWSAQQTEGYRRTLLALAERVSVQNEKKLKPLLERALRQADFTPSNHREQVAFNKLLCELMDVVRRRRHLRFTDFRDMVARNALRLQDLRPREFMLGDRLSRFDRQAARCLPGLYQPGEFYIKGLQQLSAPLFGTPPGRLVLRHLILPFGLAFLGLKTIDVVAALITDHHSRLHLATLWLVGALGLAINGIAHTRVGRTGFHVFIVSLWWTLRLVLYDGLRRLLRWRPVSTLLNTDLIRGVDRYLMRPALTGSLIVLPVAGLASFIQDEPIEPSVSLLALTLALGTLAHNTPGGRRLLDNLASSSMQALRRLNQALVMGLIKELMLFFKELTRRFQQGLHRIEELLSHHLGESILQLALKSLLVPIWSLLQSLIQFYVTVLVEPQINPVKHFPLVTIAHKLMLPFLPVITGFMLDLLEPLLPKWIAYPFITLTVLLLPGLAGFLVWELKENWKVYAANHGRITDKPGPRPELMVVRRPDLPQALIEPAIVGLHGETMRGFLRRGFHSGTLPKAFDRLRRVLRNQIRDEVDTPQRLRDAERHLADIETQICVFCDRELAYALSQRCTEPSCDLARVETRRPRLATTSFELELELYPRDTEEPIELLLKLYLLEPDLHLSASVSGPIDRLSGTCWERINEDLRVFSGRAGATRTQLEPI